MKSSLTALLLLLTTTTTIHRTTATECPPAYTGYSLKSSSNCTQYINCVNGNMVELFSCPEGTLYDGGVGVAGVCGWADSVDCQDADAGSTVPASTTVTATAQAESEPTVPPQNAVANEEMMCQLCITEGFNPTYLNYTIPNTNGMTCNTLQSISSSTPYDSSSCFDYKEIQGYCCPKCYLCGTNTSDEEMMYPNNKLIVSSSQSTDKEKEVMTCQEMSHQYHMLSYYTETETCPENPLELETDWHTTMNMGLGGIIVGTVDLMGLCGCPSSSQGTVESVASSEGGGVCTFCPEEMALVENASFTIDNDVIMSCKDGDTLSKYITDAGDCIIDPAKDAACCTVTVDNETATTVAVNNETVANSTEEITTTISDGMEDIDEMACLETCPRVICQYMANNQDVGSSSTTTTSSDNTPPGMASAIEQSCNAGTLKDCYGGDAMDTVCDTQCVEGFDPSSIGITAQDVEGTCRMCDLIRCCDGVNTYDNCNTASMDGNESSTATTTTTLPAGDGGVATTVVNPTTLNEDTQYANELAKNLKVTIEMEKNFDHGVDCSLGDWGLCYTKNVIIDYFGDLDYSNTQFKMYFSSIHRVLSVFSDDFEHEHIMGDLTLIKPKSTFQGFESMSRVRIPLVLEYWSVQETDNMPRWFVVDDRDGSTAVIPNTDTETMHDFVMPYASTQKTSNDNNIPMTAASRFTLNLKTVKEVDASTRIVPTPYKTIIDDNAQTFSINGVTLTNQQLLGGIDLLSKLGVSTSGDHPITFITVDLPAEIAGFAESYILNVTAQGTNITAADPDGFFNGLMSFIGLLDIKNNNVMALKEMTVIDKPRFEYRGHQVDAARNFRSKETILKTIDAMALWKLNVMHLALTNDEGWRLEIPGLEELTTVGSKRCFDVNEENCILTQLGSGPDAEERQFYTRQEYIEILQYAQARNVKVIPEFNMPAHARAAVMAMEARAKKGDDTYRLTDPNDETYLLTVQFYDRTSIINPCLDSSALFVEKLVQEVKLMHDDAGVPLDSYHFGGDEAKNILLGNGYASYSEELKQKPFSKSPACMAKGWNTDDSVANYWAITVNKILADNGIGEMIAWHDGLRGTTAAEYQTSSVAINFWDTLFWGGVDSLTSIDPGMDIILASPDYLYFDFPYEVNAEERGYYWAARFVSLYKSFTYAPENLAQNAETSTDRDGNEMNLVTPQVSAPAIRGMQGQTWSETIRTDEQYFEMAFPRALAVAERAWHRASWELDWSPGVAYNMTTGLVPMDELAEDYSGFASALGCREIIKLSKLGISYRVPPPGGSIDPSGILSANSELPCTIIMYSTDQGGTWSYYSTPVNIGAGQVAHLKSVSDDGTIESRVVVVDEECIDCDSSVGPSAGDSGSSDQNSQSTNNSTGTESNLTSSDQSSQGQPPLNDNSQDNEDFLNSWTAGMESSGSIIPESVSLFSFAVYVFLIIAVLK